MTQPPLPPRSALYVPASNERALAKVAQLAPDAVIVDLEDSVAPNAKATARQNTQRALEGAGFGAAQVVVRLNALDTPSGQDDLAWLLSMRGKGLDAVLLPKVSCGAELSELREALASRGVRHLAMWAMLETARGVLNAERIAQAGASALVLGTNDLCAELGVEPSADRAELSWILSRAVVVARAYGLVVLDGVYGDVRDLAGFARACRQSRALGFDGRTLIHPDTIAPCHAAFAPTAEELAAAQRIISGHREAAARGAGVCVVDGKLVEELHARAAAKLIARAPAGAGDGAARSES
jgi:citrate lyase subunit beta/citryl-CoA lyase